MYAVLGFSLGMLAWGALVAFINALVSLLLIAFGCYAALALIGGLVFVGIEVRRRIVGRANNSRRGELNCTPPSIIGR